MLGRFMVTELCRSIHSDTVKYLRHAGLGEGHVQRQGLHLSDNIIEHLKHKSVAYLSLWPLHPTPRRVGVLTLPATSVSG
jgi:hypothetical protein